MFFIVELLNKLLNKYLINTKFPFIIEGLHTFLHYGHDAPIFNEKKSKIIFFFSGLVRLGNIVGLALIFI